MNGAVIRVVPSLASLLAHQTLSGPRIVTVRSGTLAGGATRLDAKHYQEEFVLARARVYGSGYEIRTVGDLASAFVAPRIKLITGTTTSVGPPYLRAHDAFDTLPSTRRSLVTSRTPNAALFRLREGMLLTPSSGRNLGPLAYVGKYLSRFAMTDIMRIVPEHREVGMYLLAYLMTDTGQALIRRGRTGTTVDHLSPDDVTSIPIAWVDQPTREECAANMQAAESLLNRARVALDEVQRDIHSMVGLPLPIKPGRYRSASGAKVFSILASKFNTRIDAACYDPTVADARKLIVDSGGTALSSCADLRLMGRYKRYYVAPEYGRPILSGSQLAQLRPVNLKIISSRSFSDPESFVVRRGWSLFTCDGRSEDALGFPAFVSSLWDGWMASNHIMRAVPRAHIHPGFLYALLKSPYVQIQLKAMATGSVVDALDETVGASTLVFLPPEKHRDEIGARVVTAWEAIADSIRITASTVTTLDSVIGRAYEH